MFKLCWLIKIWNECIVIDNLKLFVMDFLWMLLNCKMWNGEGGMVYGK